MDPGDIAFFFYAGHGFEIAGQNFLLPTDVPATGEGQEELVRDASVLADRIIERAAAWPMTQLPEGVFSVFSAGPRQTALDPRYDRNQLAVLFASSTGFWFIPAIPGIPARYHMLPHARLTQFVSVELTYRDGSVSEIKSFRR